MITEKNVMHSVLPSVFLKFGTFEKGTKLQKNLPLKIWRYWVMSNWKWKIFSNFVPFSACPNFTVKSWRWAKFLWPSQNIRTLTWTLKPRCSKWHYEGSPLWVAVDLYLLRFVFLTFQMPRLPERIWYCNIKTLWNNEDFKNKFRTILIPYRLRMINWF